MTAYSTTADTGGFGWYHSWLLKNGTWDDNGWWADVAAWEANEGITFGIGLAGAAGVFTVTTQGANEDIVERAEAGVFTFTGQAAPKSISEAAGGQSYALTGQDISEAISEALDAGVFSLAGQDAGRGVIENLEPGYFAWKHSWLLKDGIWNDNGWWADAAAWEPNAGINFNITEIAGTGVFVLQGQNANKRISEQAETGLFVLVLQDAFLRKDRVERDGTRTSTVFTQAPNRVIISALTPNEAA